MSDDAEFYRTFQVWERNVDYFDPGEGMGSFSEVRNEPPDGIIAWMLSPADGLRPTVIVARKDQHFEKAATPWEMAHSVLVASGSKAVEPVVDRDGEVIAHIGTFPAERIFMLRGFFDQYSPKGSLQKVSAISPDDFTEDPQLDALNNGIKAGKYVLASIEKAGDEYELASSVSEHQYLPTTKYERISEYSGYLKNFLLLTDVQGRVMAAFGDHIRDVDSVTSYTPWETALFVWQAMDLAFLVRGAFELGALGVRGMIKTIALKALTEEEVLAIRGLGVDVDEFEQAFSEGALLQRGAAGGFPILDRLPGISAIQRNALKKVLGQELNADLKAAWEAAGADNIQAQAQLTEVRRLLSTGAAADKDAAYKLSEKLYENWRGRFWTRVQDGGKLERLFTDAGAKFGAKGTAPYFEIFGVRTKKLTVTLDHFLERRVDNPARAVDALNVRPSIGFENSATLESIRRDNFIKGWVSPIDPPSNSIDLPSSPGNRP